MEETTAFDYVLSKLTTERLIGRYQIQADDPIVEVTGMIDRIEQIKDAIPQAVTQSLALVETKLSTQFELVSQPLLESLAKERATIGAVQHQLASLEKRFINTGVATSPAQNWNSWLLLGCTFTILGLLGYNTVTAKLAKEMVEGNPKLVQNCRPLSAQERKALTNKFSQICSLFF